MKQKFILCRGLDSCRFFDVILLPTFRLIGVIDALIQNIALYSLEFGESETDWSSYKLVFRSFLSSCFSGMHRNDKLCIWCTGIIYLTSYWKYKKKKYGLSSVRVISWLMFHGYSLHITSGIKCPAGARHSGQLCGYFRSHLCIYCICPTICLLLSVSSPIHPT